MLIAGDGIGPEVTRAVRHVLEAAGAPIEWVERQAGLAAVGRGDEVLPAATLDAIREHGVALEGPCTTPVGEGFRSVDVSLRKTLELYAAVRPVRSLAGVETRFRDADIAVFRENTEGLYSGVENEITPGVVTSLDVATETACLRIAHAAFRYAVERQRRRVTVHAAALRFSWTPRGQSLAIECARIAARVGRSRLGARWNVDCEDCRARGSRAPSPLASIRFGQAPDTPPCAGACLMRCARSSRS